MQNVYKLIGLAMILIAAMLLAGCSDGGGANSDELRRLAGTNMPQPVQSQQATPPPRPTETPDFGDAQPAMVAPNVAPNVAPTPAPQIVYQQVEQPATVIVRETVVVESVREVVVTATPQPQAMCDPRTPAPTISLDASDTAAGVVLRGQWPCYEGGK